MDGTLLNDEKQIPQDFWPVNAQLKAKNILFCAASGRQYYTLLRQFERVKEDIVFLAENGTYVVYRGEVLHRDTMQHNDAAELIKIGRKIDNAFLILCCCGAAYVENIDEHFLTEARKYYFKLEIVEDLLAVTDTVLKVTLCDFGDSEKNSKKYYANYDQRFNVVVSGKIWLDIMNPTATKGTALAKIQQRLGIEKSETMVFGDYLNDIEMFGEADYSYAMKNAHPQVLSAAKYHTESDNNSGGVIETIKKYCL